MSRRGGGRAAAGRMQWQVMVLLGIVAAASIAGAGWMFSRSPETAIVALDAPARPVSSVTGRVHSVEIGEGETAAEIAGRLQAAGIVDSAQRFETLSAVLGWEQVLAPGRYTFEGGLTAYEVARRIRFGETSPLVVTIPEGLRLEQAAALMEASGVSTRLEFLAALERPEAAAGTLASERPAGTSLEGYLFPSTYRLPLDATAADAARAMLERFDEELGDGLAAEAAATGRTLHEVLTIASLVEREAALDAERALISAVIRNRLEQGIRLQMDSTVQYAAGSDPRSAEIYGYWKTEISAADLAIDSPYNTYASDGLPPGPIASPGRASIEAAIRPALIDSLFFAARGDGTHAFADTFAEHERNLAEIEAGRGFETAE